MRRGRACFAQAPRCFAPAQGGVLAKGLLRIDMASTLEDFWKLLVASGLIAPAECETLAAAYARVRGPKQGSPKSLCAWLIERGMLSRYQARLLMAGRSGPFFFGNYRIYDRVESGRLTGVFHASDRQTGQPVMLYFFTGAATQDLKQWLPIEARAQLAAGVKHPNVSRVDALVQADGYKFLVLESLNGQSLDEVMAGQPLPVDDVCRYLRKAAAGLARLHSLNQIHGDIRPDNLWLDPTGQVKLLYFPLSREPLASAAAPARNADFQAPECGPPANQAASPPSDIYSLGCTAYYLLSGHVPFPGGELADKPRRHVAETPPPLTDVPGVPGPLARLIAAMMAKSPKVRVPNAMRVAEALQSVMSGVSTADTDHGKTDPAIHITPPSPSARGQVKEPTPQPTTAPTPTNAPIPTFSPAPTTTPPAPAAPYATQFTPAPNYAAGYPPGAMMPPGAMPPSALPPSAMPPYAASPGTMPSPGFPPSAFPPATPHAAMPPGYGNPQPLYPSQYAQPTPVMGLPMGAPARRTCGRGAAAATHHAPRRHRLGHSRLHLALGGRRRR